jgi:hypothetical protein
VSDTPSSTPSAVEADDQGRRFKSRPVTDHPQVSKFIEENLPPPYGRRDGKPVTLPWGTFANGNSKLSRVMRQLEKELRLRYRTDEPEAARLVREVASWRALQEMCRENIGARGCSTFRMQSYAKTARLTMQMLERLPNVRVGEEERPTSGEALAALAARWEEARRAQQKAPGAPTVASARSMGIPIDLLEAPRRVGEGEDMGAIPGGISGDAEPGE